jgi:L-fucose mutarotase
MLFALRTMGHGDEIVIADANFPASTLGPKVIRADGVGGEQLLEGILSHMPLDDFVPLAAFRMEVVDDQGRVPDICQSYQQIIHRLSGRFELGAIERFAFYERSRAAAYIIASGERAFYANIILKKGVVGSGS